MGIDISSLDLLYLALAVVGYATCATLWTFFYRPVAEGEGKLSREAAIISPAAVVEFFDDAGVNAREVWQKAPGGR